MRALLPAALLLLSAPLGAQERPTNSSPVVDPGTVDPQAARVQSDAAAVTLDEDVAASDRAAPLASRVRGARIVSRNEAYNQQRAAEGRVGVRLGDDMSFTADGN
jgi:hypothetical protein